MEIQPKQKFMILNFIDQPVELRIMAVAEGYVMCRWKGCVPFVTTLKDLKKRIKTSTIKTL